MKKTNTIFWISTGLFAALMMFSAIPDIILTADAKAFIGHLGYPDYFICFIGVAKALGSIAIVIPGYPRIKEWAYAGLFYDLIAAVVSQLATDGFAPGIFFMLVPIGICFTSYLFHYKRLTSAA
jgi:hypothetical protein